MIICQCFINGPGDYNTNVKKKINIEKMMKWSANVHECPGHPKLVCSYRISDPPTFVAFGNTDFCFVLFWIKKPESEVPVVREDSS